MTQTVLAIRGLAPMFDRVADFRRGRNYKATRDLAAKPWQFKQPAFRPTEPIIVPTVSSVRRQYIPIGFLGAKTVASDLAYVVYEAEPYVFALLTSAMHMAWTRAVGGRMKTDYRYSNTIVHNNFPVPPLSDPTKEQVTMSALRVLDVREYHCERTLAELYDPDNMPADLRAAHAEVNEMVDAIYSKSGDTSYYGADPGASAQIFADGSQEIAHGVVAGGGL